MGIPVEYSFHEDSPSQHEIDLRYTDALDDGRQRDDVPARRARGRRIEQGVYATFMPKPLDGVQGSGMHTHMSLFEGDENAFHDAGDPLQAVEGRPGLHRRPAAPRAARSPPITNQTVNSYKRLIAGFEAPVYVSVGPQQPLGARAGADHEAGKAASTRIEYRAPDPACNPYLAFSVMLAAGLKGIEEGYELPPRGARRTSSSSPTRSGPPRASIRCRSRCPRRST